ncbi:MAG: glycosyltransferase family 39 protein [Anaerolineae bacterium]|nr:MAG: glycosyltransferase family 39 protein [Anaerolineae bacterium]
MLQSRRTVTGIMVALFLTAFFLRAYRPLSLPTQWLDRAEILNTALDARDWRETHQSPHPGFTTMVISGTSLRLYDAAKGTPAEALFDWAYPAYTTEFGRRMAVGVLGLALVISGLIVAITLTLRRLSDWRLALTFAGLLTFAPFYLAQGRVLHVDALVSTLMLLSALLLLLSLQGGQRRYLLLSGLVAGFALLTKIPSVFLVPFTGLALLVHLVIRLQAEWSEHGEGRARWILQQSWRELVLPGLLWGLMVLVPIAMWPAMWEKPLKVFRSMANRTSTHRVTPHLRTFFVGDVYYQEEVGVLFYLATMAFNSTFLTLSLLPLAVGHYTAWRKRVKPPLTPVAFWLMVAYLVFFTVQMNLGAKKIERYILPAHPALDFLAAVGLVGVMDLLQRAFAGRRERLARAVPAMLGGLAVALQAAVALPFAPSYDAHHNYLLGGNPVAVNVIDFTGQGEGVPEVISYLYSQPDAEAPLVGIPRTIDTALMQYMPAENVLIGMTAEADFHLFDMVAMQREVTPRQWEPAWLFYQERNAPPQLVVIFDRVTYMWLYPTRPDETFQQRVIRRGGAGFVWLAWVWTAALLGGVAWALVPRRRMG